ncbi:MAG: hypothetical protein NZ700_17510 [Gemmataceae bacterium]|nr:hypothetical protein [Gemmataceae bacterium]MDW8265752.1 hypothetical protein [Gemmataceae bacterium]
MATKRSVRVEVSHSAITAERAARLYRLVKLLADGPMTRDSILRKLRLNVRTFYRDLGCLRAAGIHLTCHDRRYGLPGPVNNIILRLPFPDPNLSVGEAMTLAKGRTAAHQRLKAQVDRIVGSER